MAAYPWPTGQFPSELFVESCGAILFDLSAPSSPRVGILRERESSEWFLSKGRRSAGESRWRAALRETHEETGVPCRLIPIRLRSRAPGMFEHADAGDFVRVHENLASDPFMVRVREVPAKEGGGVKIIWWFVAEVDYGADEKMFGAGEDAFETAFLGCEEAVERLTYQNDKDVLRKAIGIVRGM